MWSIAYMLTPISLKSRLITTAIILVLSLIVLLPIWLYQQNQANGDE